MFLELRPNLQIIGDTDYDPGVLMTLLPCVYTDFKKKISGSEEPLKHTILTNCTKNMCDMS